MHRVRVIILAAVVVCAALAAFFFWPSSVTDEQPHAPVAGDLDRPALPSPPLMLPVAPALGPDRDDDPQAEELADDPVTSVASLTLPFLDDLAQRLVDRYHPPHSRHNTGARGVLLMSMSALNRVYGVEMIGLAHSSRSVLEARKEIFEAMLQPEVIDTAWQAFGSFFLQTVIDQALVAERVFVQADSSRTQRVLSVDEVADFLQLLATFTARIAQAVHVYASSETAVERTAAWLSVTADVFAANSRYQFAEAMLEQSLSEPYVAEEKIRSLREERDQASQEMLQSIEHRENAKEQLLALFKNDSVAKRLSDGDQLYISQWLYRRLEQHPERSPALVRLAEHMNGFAESLREAAETVTAPVPEEG